MSPIPQGLIVPRVSAKWLRVNLLYKWSLCTQILVFEFTQFAPSFQSHPSTSLCMLTGNQILSTFARKSFSAQSNKIASVLQNNLLLASRPDLHSALRCAGCAQAEAHTCSFRELTQNRFADEHVRISPSSQSYQSSREILLNTRTKHLCH